MSNESFCEEMKRCQEEAREYANEIKIEMKRLMKKVEAAESFKRSFRGKLCKLIAGNRISFI